MFEHIKIMKRFFKKYPLGCVQPLQIMHANLCYSCICSDAISVRTGRWMDSSNVLRRQGVPPLKRPFTELPSQVRRCLLTTFSHTSNQIWPSSEAGTLTVEITPVHSKRSLRNRIVMLNLASKNSRKTRFQRTVNSLASLSVVNWFLTQVSRSSLHGLFRTFAFYGGEEWGIEHYLFKPKIRQQSY
ncbi:hypothetical protein BDR05DRAFT_326998 [Suillus weaverae]|nr:hypothetical protein BDR05DRAFT_326998 [Suillus weaverae]